MRRRARGEGRYHGRKRETSVLWKPTLHVGYGLDDPGVAVQFPVGATDFSLLHDIQNGSGAHPVSTRGIAVGA
jgi:hypothetical protein